MKKPVTFKSFFASLRLTAALLILIVLAAAFGTVAPPSLDVYHSFWFSALLGLLSLNLIVCSWQRFPASWKRFRPSASPDRSGVFERLPADQIIFTQSGLNSETERIERLLRSRYGKVETGGTGEDVILSGEKNAFSVFGFYIVHAGVLVIIAGAIIGSLLGFSATMNIAEGETADSVALNGRKGERPLDFAVRLDRFYLDFYENGMPKTYRSDLTFLKNGTAAFQGSVLVNHPLVFEGLRFYQASYGTAGGGEASLGIHHGGRQTVRKVRMGDRFQLPGGKAEVEILRVEENLMQMGAAVKISIPAEKGDIQFWVFQHIGEIERHNPGLLKMMPQFDPGRYRPYLFSLAGVESRYYSGLQVTRDPGAPLVAAGAVFMMAGFMVVFFIPHRRLWVRITADGGKTKIAVTGAVGKDPRGMEREMRRFIEDCRNRENTGT
jgi:cytochrome c biogenesis protein